MPTLHYIYDPLCGWCYAAAPLIAEARDNPGLSIALHGGGMMTGPGRRPITPQWRDYVIGHDKRIAQATGQPFGEAYFEGLLRDNSAVMDSAPPTTAILAAQEQGGRGLDMLHRVQHAHYAEGRRIADKDVLAQLAQELGLEPAKFAEAFKRLEGPATEQHFIDSRKWLTRLGGQGFPTVALEHADGAIQRLEIGAWLGKVDGWREQLRKLAPVEVKTPAAQCGIDGCTIP
jgi:putative protein-disulfide isomerase